FVLKALWAYMISGLCIRRPRNSWVAWSNSLKSPPNLSKTFISNPEETPNPGTLGGAKNTMFASGMVEAIWNILAVNATDDKLSAFLSSQLLSLINPIPKLLPAPEIILNPFTIDAPSTPGSALSLALSSSVTCTVLSKLAPGANSILAKIIPLSSAGTKPVGVVVAAQYIPATDANKIKGVIHLCR